MIKSYRKQFFEWVNKQPVYQNMTLQTKEMSLILIECWLNNNNQAYFHCARLYGKEFAKICAIEFCWFIKNKTISDLQHRLKVAEKALNKMSAYAIGNYELFTLINDFNIKNGRYDEDHSCLNTCDVVDYFKEQAEKELKGE